MRLSYRAYGEKGKFMWIAVAEYADGTRIEKKFPYSEDGNYNKECEKQYELEEWLIGQHDDCVFYSVSYEEVAA